MVVASQKIQDKGILGKLYIYIYMKGKVKRKKDMNYDQYEFLKYVY